MNKELIVSKVLVCDQDDKALNRLKSYFERKGLIGLSCRPDNLINLLNRNTDLGGIFISDDYFTGTDYCRTFVTEIHEMRPELPIFYRVNNIGSSELTEIASVVAGFYTQDDIEALDYSVNKHLFNMFYPVPLIRAVQRVSQEALETVISGADIDCERTYLVKDKIIYGELFSLIPIESDWCRGYMMLQTSQGSMLDVIREGKTALDKVAPTFRDVNEVLNEITNLIWGKLKAKYLHTVDTENNQIQVPILVNHSEKYISFGSKEPQLCFRYQIKDRSGKSEPITIFQKMIFNLSWEPDSFKEVEESLDELVECGELEFF